MEPSFVFSPPLVKGLRAKQLHHTATRSWVYNNDKRIVPPGGKRFYTLETENCVAVGAVGGAFSGRRAWGTRSIQTNGRKQGGAQRGSSNRKQLHEILMAYIYWQATVSSNSHRGPQGEGGGVGVPRFDWQPLGEEAHMTHTHRHRNTLTHRPVKIWAEQDVDDRLIPPLVRMWIQGMTTMCWSVGCVKCWCNQTVEDQSYF